MRDLLSSGHKAATQTDAAPPAAKMFILAFRYDHGDYHIEDNPIL